MVKTKGMEKEYGKGDRGGEMKEDWRRVGKRKGKTGRVWTGIMGKACLRFWSKFSLFAHSYADCV